MSCIIELGSPFDCTVIKAGGIQKEVMLYNLADYKASTITQVDDDSPITDVVNALGKQAYSVQAADETGIVPDCVLRPIEGNVDKFTHSMKMPIFASDQASRNNFSKLRGAPVVAVIMRNDGTGLVYGAGGGMYLTEWIDQPQSPETGSIIWLTVATKETQAGEPYQPVVLDAGTPAATQAIFDAMITPGA